MKYYWLIFYICSITDLFVKTATNIDSSGHTECLFVLSVPKIFAYIFQFRNAFHSVTNSSSQCMMVLSWCRQTNQHEHIQEGNQRLFPTVSHWWRLLSTLGRFWNVLQHTFAVIKQIAGITDVLSLIAESYGTGYLVASCWLLQPGDWSVEISR